MGKVAHRTIDTKTYSTSSHVLQGIDVFSDEFRICGKIDVFNVEDGRLIERKREIKSIYDGYIFQVYAQVFGLRELGYIVKSIVIHDLTHNRNYPVPLPEKNEPMLIRFKRLIERINEFDLEESPFEPVKSKCINCIYSNLCDASLC